MFYHGELHQPDASDFYSYIGLAVSTDGGLTFEDLGQIIRPEMAVDDPDRQGAVDVGPGAYMIKDGNFYVYFKDSRGDGSTVNMAVARAPISEVLAAAELGTTSTWLKYSGGTFSTPGVGGAADNIFEFSPSYTNWMDVVYLEQLDQYVMVTTSINNSSIGSMHYITTSEDGIEWSVVEEIYDDYSPDELPYVTLSAPGYLNQKTITGTEFELIRTVSTSAYTGFRWTDARVERLTISFQAPDPEPETPDPGEGSGDPNTPGNSSGASGSGEQEALASSGISLVPALATTGLLITALGTLYRLSVRKPYPTRAK
jgi:hypothetical protein